MTYADKRTGEPHHGGHANESSILKQSTSEQLLSSLRRALFDSQDDIYRGGREFPIAANFVGKKIKLSAEGEVRVKLKEVDKVDEVVVSG